MKKYRTAYKVFYKNANGDLQPYCRTLYQDEPAYDHLFQNFIYRPQWWFDRPPGWGFLTAFPTLDKAFDFVNRENRPFVAQGKTPISLEIWEVRIRVLDPDEVPAHSRPFVWLPVEHDFNYLSFYQLPRQTLITDEVFLAQKITEVDFCGESKPRYFPNGRNHFTGR